MTTSDPRPAMKDELHHLVEVVAHKPNGVRALSILIDQANVLAAYKANRGPIHSRGRRPRPKPDQTDCNKAWREFLGE